MKKLFTLTLGALLTALLVAPTPVSADEGMWLPSQIESQVRDMRQKGFRLKATDLYNDTAEPALSDAIVLFDGGCTGAIVSAEGLLLTNHHCGYDYVVGHSSVESDFLTDGFWAMSKEEELPNPGLEVAIMVRMENVTDAVNAGRRDELIETASEGGRYRVQIKPLYYGGEHWMWVYEVFTDVRLVAAPPSAIGKFGGDTDNWVWPRHTGDFSAFRIYAGADNRPADYHPDNKPYAPAKFFEIATDGVKEGDFTFVYGFPGTTQEYVTSDAVRYIVERSNPMKIDLRTRVLDIVREASEADRATRIAYAARQASIANAWKKWQGESWGLKRRGTVARKTAQEDAFREWAAAPDPADPSKPAHPEYVGLLDSLAAAYEKWEGGLYLNEWFNETFGMMGALGTAGEDGERIFSEVDRRIAVALLEGFADWAPRHRLPPTFTRALDSLGSYQAMAADPEGLLKLREDIWAEFDVPRVGSFNAIPDIVRWYTPYMRALREFDTDRRFYPDANLTLRITYGAVAGYGYEDGVWHEPVTTIDGIVAKDNPEIYDYDIPERLRDVLVSGDYGRWGVEMNGRGTVPVCFLASNHTSGGNSGSPILNGRGELLGLNFDRTWLGTMSDVEFDPEICRNISVDIRYVMFVMEKVGGAGWLVDEMTFAE
ncbi:MAG: S46 family peptidase [Alistipes sp.]|jgi:hypothetical protein|nr:S46 family peptidase [Alistipes sp.]